MRIDETDLISYADARRSADARQILALRRNLEHVKQHSADLVRERSVWALSLVQNGEVVRPLVAELRNDDWRVRAYAAWALAVVNDMRALEALLYAARDEHWRVRMHALFALGELSADDARITDVMVAGLDDDEWQVRAIAAEHLGKVNGVEAVEALRQAARDPNEIVREMASQSLRQRERRF